MNESKMEINVYKSLTLVLLAMSVSFSEEVAQTDWSGGYGIPGPVTDWLTFYDNSTDVLTYGEGLELSRTITTNFGRFTVDSLYDAVTSVGSADIDGDGDMDILAGSCFYPEYGGKLTWWNNIDGTGTDWETNTILHHVYLQSLHTDDVDGDGDIDVLVAAHTPHYQNNGYIIWQENLDGAGTCWLTHNLGYFNGAISVYSADIDNDGDIDILGAAADDDEIAWWEVTDGFSCAGFLESSILDVGDVEAWDSFSCSRTAPEETLIGVLSQNNQPSKTVLQ